MNSLVGKQDLTATFNTLSQTLHKAAATVSTGIHEHSSSNEDSQKPGAPSVNAGTMPLMGSMRPENTASGGTCGNLSEQDQVDMVSAFCLVAAWSVAVSAYSANVLELLEQHEGYLCKVCKLNCAILQWESHVLQYCMTEMS
jgi:hypothetical protein